MINKTRNVLPILPDDQKRVYSILIYSQPEADIKDTILNKIHLFKGNKIKEENWGLRKIKTASKHNKLEIHNFIIEIDKHNMEKLVEFCKNSGMVNRNRITRFKNPQELQYALENDSMIMEYEKTLIKT